MPTLNVALPKGLARNFVGGPGYSTTVVPMLSGYESRNQNWSLPRSDWVASYPFSRSKWEDLQAFFILARGQLHSFWFEAPNDYQIGDPDTGEYQTIGSSDGMETDFQIYKTYSNGVTSLNINRTQIVPNTTRVWVDGVEQSSGWTVDPTTGIVAFGVSPSGSPDPVISVACQFYHVVRFNTDSLEVQMLTNGLASVPGLALIEVIGE